MKQKIRDIMPRGTPTRVKPTETLSVAAKKMKSANIGCVLVMDGEEVVGLLTDRDIVVRAVAEGLDPVATAAGDVCSKELATLSPDDLVDNAIELMRKKAIRRIPVMEDQSVLGVVSLGDLALERDPTSVLGGISSAKANV
ncbi:MAG: CBS domain-containing protein [Myxococcales bacterium]|nr:CBS domain-containing protein [Myxococcales bacterium]MCB9578594.1 CBS domain-containing protein [Polyangiaceae bacterium]